MDDSKHRKKRKKIIRGVLTVLLAAATGVFLFFAVRPLRIPPNELKSYYHEKGVEETGSVNLVSSIYLGYRAMDTLGETIVLLLTVTGVMAVMGAKR